MLPKLSMLLTQINTEYLLTLLLLPIVITLSFCYRAKVRMLEENKVLRAMERSRVGYYCVVEEVKRNEEMRVIWCTKGFIEWASRSTGKDYSNIIGKNWFEIFPVSPAWKEYYIEVLTNQKSVSNDFYYYKEADQFLQWVVIPVDKNKLLFSLNDITKLGKYQEMLEEANKIMVEAGLGEKFNLNNTLFNN